MSTNHIITVAKLAQGAANAVSYAPDAVRRTAIAVQLGLLKLPKFTFRGQLTAMGAQDWQLEGHLGATVVQRCVVTLEPVTTRIDDKITRIFVADWSEPDETEAEMPEDDTQEPLGAQIDIDHIAVEALALALPDFPKAPDVTFDGIVAAEPGTDPLTDETAKPFAGLASLKAKLEKDD